MGFTESKLSVIHNIGHITPTRKNRLQILGNICYMIWKYKSLRRVSHQIYFIFFFFWEGGLHILYNTNTDQWWTGLLAITTKYATPLNLQYYCNSKLGSPCIQLSIVCNYIDNYYVYMVTLKPFKWTDRYSFSYLFY